MEMSVNGMAPIGEAKTICQLQQEEQQRRKRNAFSPQLPSSQKIQFALFFQLVVADSESVTTCLTSYNRRQNELRHFAQK